MTLICSVWTCHHCIPNIAHGPHVHNAPSRFLSNPAFTLPLVCPSTSLTAAHIFLPPSPLHPRDRHPALIIHAHPPTILVNHPTAAPTTAHTPATFALPPSLRPRTPCQSHTAVGQLAYGSTSAFSSLPTHCPPAARALACNALTMAPSQSVHLTSAANPIPRLASPPAAPAHLQRLSSLKQSCLSTFPATNRSPKPMGVLLRR